MLEKFLRSSTRQACVLDTLWCILPSNSDATWNAIDLLWTRREKRHYEHGCMHHNNNGCWTQMRLATNDKLCGMNLPGVVKCRVEFSAKQRCDVISACTDMIQEVFYCVGCGLHNLCIPIFLILHITFIFCKSRLWKKRAIFVFRQPRFFFFDVSA